METGRDLERFSEIELVEMVYAAKKAIAEGKTISHNEAKKQLGFIKKNKTKKQLKAR